MILYITIYMALLAFAAYYFPKKWNNLVRYFVLLILAVGPALFYLIVQIKNMPNYALCFLSLFKMYHTLIYFFHSDEIKSKIWVRIVRLLLPIIFIITFYLFLGVYSFTSKTFIISIIFQLAAIIMDISLTFINFYKYPKLNVATNN